MSRDPLDELFGPDPGEPARSTPVDPAPVPATTPVAERARREEMTTQPVPTHSRRRSTALPWVIVAIVGILAIVGSLFIVNLVQRGADTGAPTSTTGSGTTGSDSSNTTQSNTATSPGTGTSTAKPGTTTPSATTGGTAPKTDVGPTYSMDVGAAGITVQVSQKLGDIEWYYQNAEVPAPRVMFHSALLGSFPDSCSAMRSVEGKSPWGIQDAGDGKWTVVRPSGTCAANTKLYDQVWGLLQALADSAKPLEAKEAAN